MKVKTVGRILPRHLSLLLFSLIVTFFASANSTAQTIYTTDDGQPFQVRVFCPDKDLFAGEVVTIVLEIRNLSGVCLEISADSENVTDEMILFTNPDDHSKIEFTGEFPLVRGQEPVQIQPGNFFQKRFSLPFYYFKVTGRQVIDFTKSIVIGGVDSIPRIPISITATTEIEISPSGPEAWGKRINHLTEALRSEDFEAAAETVNRMVQIKDPRILPALGNVLTLCEARTDPEGELPRELEQIAQFVTIGVVMDYQDVFGDTEEINGFLQRLKHSPSVLIRKTFAAHLARLGHFSCFEGIPTHPERRLLLLEMHDDPNPEIRAIVAMELGEIGGPEAERILREMLEDGDGTVREKARESLDKRKAAKP